MSKPIKKVIPNEKQQAHAKHQVKIGGMHCSFCASSITQVISKLPGIENVNVSLAHEEALIQCDPINVQPYQIDTMLRSLGYTVRDPNKIRSFEEDELGVIYAGPTLKILHFSYPNEETLEQSVRAAHVNYQGILKPVNGTFQLNFTAFSPVRIEPPTDAMMLVNKTETYCQFWNFSDSKPNILPTPYLLHYKNQNLVASIHGITSHEVIFSIRSSQVPEFPFSILTLLVAIISIVLISRMKYR